MPNRNGTGPSGNGPTGFRGRSNGGCVESDTFAAAPLQNQGRMRGGRGMMGGRNQRMHQRMSGAIAPNLPQPQNVELDDIYHELDTLKAAVAELHQALAHKQKTIEELEQQVTEEQITTPEISAGKAPVKC